MPKWPHFYILRENWQDAIPWENVVQFMRDTGYRGHFNKTPRMYWRFGEFKYWSMGYGIDITTVINRDDWWRNYSKIKATMDPPQVA